MSEQNKYHTALLISGNPNELLQSKIDLLNVTKGLPVLQRDGMAISQKWVTTFREILRNFEVYEDTPRYLSVYFDCEVPPIEAVFFFSAKYPDLTFRMDFGDPSRDISGSTTVVGGVSALELFDTPDTTQSEEKFNFLADAEELSQEDIAKLFEFHEISAGYYGSEGRKKKILLN